MYIQPVNATSQRNNSQPTFNGYVDKKVVKIVKTLTQRSIDDVEKNANESYQKVDIRKLNDIKNMSLVVLAKLECFMEDLHKHSVLTLDKTKTRLVVRNKKLKSDIGFAYYRDVTNNTGRVDKTFHRIDVYSPNLVGASNKELKDFYNFAGVLINAPRKEEIDEYLFKKFTQRISKQADNTSFFSGIITYYNAKKADRLAPEFKGVTGWVEKLAEIRSKAIARKEIETANDRNGVQVYKELKKENSKITKK